MLVKSNTDCLRVDFYKLGKRILQSSSHWNCAADCKVKFREFLAGNVACRINRGSGLINNSIHNIRIIFADYLAYNRLNFLASGSVSDCDNLNIVLVNRIIDCFIWAFWICNLLNQKVAQIFSSFIKGGAFCSSADSRVNTKNAATFYRLSHQEVL